MSVALDLIGGVGLFLLGIMLFMESMRSIAGDALRRGILRFTDTPWKALLTGTVTTTFIQSAHATLVIAMGLAGAGMLSGAQALAILLGANIGTTGTAWLVALLGLRVGFGPFAVILVAGGAFTRLLTRSKWGIWGQTAAGFGLLFVGIDLLADGMSSLDIGLSGVTGNGGFLAALALIGIGALTTILTQSSSVTVAATITAVFAGVIPVQDAAWLVIGQNLGTTSTLALVSIGATAPGRRLALAHVVVNGSTAIVIIALFRPLLWLTTTAIHGIGGDDALVVAGFHTLFNVLGAVIWMPLIGVLTARLQRWVPDKGPRLTAGLDSLAASVPGVAVESARRAVAETAAEVCGVIRSRLQHGALQRGTETRLEGVDRAMLHIEDFLAKVQSSPDHPNVHRMHVHVVHALERLDHMVEACRIGSLNRDALRAPAIAATYEGFSQALKEAREWLHGDLTQQPDDLLERLDGMQERRHDDQDRLLETTALGEMVLPDAMAQLDATAWMTHQARSLHRLILQLVPLDSDGEGVGGDVDDVEIAGAPSVA